MVLYGLYCCIMELFSLVLYGRARSCIVFFGCVWSIRFCHVLYGIVENYTVLEGPVCSCRFLFDHTLSSVWSSMDLNDISVLLVVFLYVLAKSWFVLNYSHEWSISVLEGYLCFFIDLYPLALSKLQIQGLDQSETLKYLFWKHSRPRRRMIFDTYAYLMLRNRPLPPFPSKTPYLTLSLRER